MRTKLDLSICIFHTAPQINFFPFSSHFDPPRSSPVASPETISKASHPWSSAPFLPALSHIFLSTAAFLFPMGRPAVDSQGPVACGLNASAGLQGLPLPGTDLPFQAYLLLPSTHSQLLPNTAIHFPEPILCSLFLEFFPGLILSLLPLFCLYIVSSLVLSHVPFLSLKPSQLTRIYPPPPEILVM